jgi:hypothetical protein
MTPLNKTLTGLLSALLLLPAYNGFSQGAEKANLSIAISYFNTNNRIPYVAVNVKSKLTGRFQPVGGVAIKLYLDKDSAGTFIGKVVTSEKGEAHTFIPPSLQKEWAGSKSHTFLATFDGDKVYESGKADLTVARAKILIDTIAGRSVVATLLELKDTTWTPVKGADVVLAVRRLGGDLNINETATFATDSTGKASGDFKRDNIPGDAKGGITLVAKIVDNEQFGNLSVEKTVPWGAKFKYQSTFNERALFATRDKAPIWLQFIAYSITFAVWGVLIYLLFNIFKIKKLGGSTKVL